MLYFFPSEGVHLGKAKTVSAAAIFSVVSEATDQVRSQ